jgi:tetratricopeptide (TPR) repeat protein
VIVRSEDPSAALTLSMLISTIVQQEGQGSVSVAYEHNTYPLALLLLASYEVEHRRYGEALPWLDRGLALQPNNQYLSFEKVAALQGQRRFQEAADILQGLIDNPGLTLTLDRDRAYRNLGVVLIDLNRLDEAEAALNESIRLEPNNPAARHELEYIADLRRGAAPRQLELQSPASRQD